LAKVHLDAAFAARLSDIAELENGSRQCAVETSRGIGPGSNVTSSQAKEPATDPIAMRLARGWEVCQLLAVKSQAGRRHQPRQGTISAAAT
jgi:hypothetical protein